MHCVVDVETDSLTPSTIHCIVVKNIDTAEVSVFRESECFTHWPSFSRNISKYIMHNGVSFDAPVLNRLTGTRIRVEDIEDTLLMSEMADPRRNNGHSLEAWGLSLGYPKLEFSDWSSCTDEMVDYCKRDVDLTEKVYRRLEKELKDFSSGSIRMEHLIRYVINMQQKNGFTLDIKKAMNLKASLADAASKLEEEVTNTFYPLPAFVKEVLPKIKAEGTLSKVGLGHLGDDWELAWGPHSVVKFDTFNLSSRQQIVRHLQHRGWKPTTFTEKGSPQIDETVLKGVEIKEAQMIARYLLLQKRISQIKQWIDYYQDDGKVHGKVLTLKAITGRMAHHAPNMAQIPSARSEYGEECRQCWTASGDDRLLVGCDASSLELRAMAHYMGDEKFSHEVVNGDIHTANQKAAGLSTRDQAKTFIYAFIYGAGPAKIGSIVGGSARDGQRLIDQFLANVPALKRLRHHVDIAAKRGQLQGLDGRMLKVQSQHAALNLLIQGAGAVICKQWLLDIIALTRSEGLDAKLVASIHDEYQFDVKKEHAELFGKLTQRAMKQTQKTLGLRCQLDSEYKVGKTWAETH
jgi:DNA polymerase I